MGGWRSAAFVMIGLVLGLGCYETKVTSLRVRAPNTRLDCMATADRVFMREGFVAAPNAVGTRLYTPMASATNAVALGWGIAVTIDGGPRHDGWGRCTFDLQALSTEENCGILCPLTPQPGFDDITRKMAWKLDAAFNTPVPLTESAER